MSRQKLIAALAMGSLCLVTAVVVTQTGPSLPKPLPTAPTVTPATATNGGNNSAKQGVLWDSAKPIRPNRP
jgi:hypothetical protein